MPGVIVAPFPYCFHCPVLRERNKHTKEGSGAKTVVGSCNKYGFWGSDCCNHPLEQVDLLFKTQTTPSETAAILLEPILGEGGYVFPPKSFLQGLREICDKNNVLLLADEVQTGFGRTGKMFAVEHYGVIPDILVMAKGIASGYPLSGIVSRKELMDKQPAGSMGGTFGGNVVACAAAIATLDVFRDENILQNVNLRSQQLISGLQLLQSRWPDKVADIRGLGLMVGIEFNAPYGTATAISQSCMKHGMLLLTTSVFEVVRLVPALTITQEEVGIALEILNKSFEDVFGPPSRAE